MCDNKNIQKNLGREKEYSEYIDIQNISAENKYSEYIRKLYIIHTIRIFRKFCAEVGENKSCIVFAIGEIQLIIVLIVSRETLKNVSRYCFT